MIGNWIRSNIGVYVGNATATRDFRVQLRGNKAILLWGFYLIVLIGFAMITYSNSANGYEGSIVEAQRSLRNFYQSIMILLAVMVNLIAPALTAGAIVSERQRHSLDLVFSAPVSAKYYLVGKMISSYRYVWMLLILSLPVTSACVVLGGATWSDVIAAYMILSFNALIYTSMALLISSISRQSVAAIVWSYVAAICYSIFSSIVGAVSTIGVMFGSRTLEAPFTITLNPYTVVQAAPTFTTMYGYQIPNWILGALMALLMSKVLILAAASSMSGYGAADTKSLRIHGIVFTFITCALYAYTTHGPVTMISSGMRRSTLSPSAPTTWTPALDQAFAWMLVPFVVLLPFAVCYGLDAERRYWPDGTFSIKAIFRGTPSGGLPYLWSLILAGYAGFWFALSFYGSDGPSMAILFWMLALWTFYWSIGRLSSSFNSGLRASRGLMFTITLALVALPVPFFSAIHTFSSSDSGIWNVYILRPLIGAEDNRDIAWVYGVLMAAVSVGLTFLAETNAARKGVQSRYAT